MSDAWIEALSLRSSTREKILEHRFLAELASEFWRRGQFDFGISRGEVDDSGYDVIVEVGDVSRHIQLKAKYEGGRTARYNIQKALELRPSGCVVVMLHNPRDLKIGGFYFLGALPGKPLPDLGSNIAKHTKGDSEGVKGLRSALRTVALGKFDFVEGIRSLADTLFGTRLPPATDI